MERKITQTEIEEMEIFSDDGNGSQFVLIDDEFYDLTNGYLSTDLTGWDNR